MKPNEVIKTALFATKTTQLRLSEMLGYGNQSCISSRLDSKMSADMLIEWLDKLGYEIVVQPKTQGKRKEGSIVLESSGKPDGRGKKNKAKP